MEIVSYKTAKITQWISYITVDNLLAAITSFSILFAKKYLS